MKGWTPVEHAPCDEGVSDPFRAMGIGCAGEPDVSTSTRGSPQAIGVRLGFGNTEVWAPREGSAYAVVGTGMLVDLDLETPASDSNMSPTHCNDDLGGEHDLGTELPAPLSTTPVDGNCASNPALVGTGDCSNTIARHFENGGTANDYAELRLEAVVPAQSTSFSYDFAFLTTEYPFYFGSEFNDMYLAWLESERWTGNISFDADGDAVTLNTSLLDRLDNSGDLAELVGTCLRHHAATSWLSTTAPVVPGEQITVVFAIFDATDSILDTYAFLDDFRWGCEDLDRPRTQ